MGRHRRNNPKKIPGAKNIAPFLLYDFNFFGNYHLPSVNYEKTVGISLPFDYYVRVLEKFNKA
jgi:hypothetical protein